MRIALLTHQWPGIRMGGIGAAVRQTAAALAQAGHDVHVFTFSIPEDLRSTIPQGLHFHQVSDLASRVQRGTLNPVLTSAIEAGGEGAYRLSLGCLLCQALLEIHAQTPFDIIESPEVDALSLPLLLNENLDVPIVTHLHCCTALAHLGNQKPAERSQTLTMSLEFAAIHLADAVCAPTRAVVAATERFIPIPREVAIVPHPYQCGPTPFSPPPADGPILFIGRIERLKGVATIVEALNSFLPRHPGVIFRFIGPDTSSAPAGGSMRQFLQSQLRGDIAPRVQFAGELSPAQIERELAYCSFCVQPSFWENFSMACCEAFAAGRTVIVGEGTGSVELIGAAGLAVDPDSPKALANAMQSLWSDRTSLAQRSSAAHARIRKEFSPGSIARQRSDFYRHVIQNFHSTARTNLQARLATLPAAHCAALLPALCALTGALAGTKPAERGPGPSLLKIMETLSPDSKPARVLLYGAGKFTSRLLSQRAIWESKGHRVVGLIDDHPRFVQQPTHLDLPVRSLKNMIAELSGKQDSPPVILSTDTYQDQFWAQTQPLRDQGVKVIRIDETPPTA